MTFQLISLPLPKIIAISERKRNPSIASPKGILGTYLDNPIAKKEKENANINPTLGWVKTLITIYATNGRRINIMAV
ncbi:MAG: hypothetical protein U9N54_00600, partial [candidate division Zixibacteria bacterium]|nr:hypothetical protein [candidate division Zixibacteria bacterium]